MARRVKVRGSRRQVWNGTRLKTMSGMTKDKLMLNKRGKIVSRAKSVLAKARWETGVGKWITSVMEARKALGITGFVAIKKGSAFYNCAMELYKIRSYKRMRRRSIQIKRSRQSSVCLGVKKRSRKKSILKTATAYPIGTEKRRSIVAPVEEPSEDIRAPSEEPSEVSHAAFKPLARASEGEETESDAEPPQISSREPSEDFSLHSSKESSEEPSTKPAGLVINGRRRRRKSYVRQWSTNALDMYSAALSNERYQAGRKAMKGVAERRRGSRKLGSKRLGRLARLSAERMG